MSHTPGFKPVWITIRIRSTEPALTEEALNRMLLLAKEAFLRLDMTALDIRVELEERDP